MLIWIYEPLLLKNEGFFLFLTAFKLSPTTSAQYKEKLMFSPKIRIFNHTQRDRIQIKVTLE